MNLTDHIINVALLGTATRELITTDFPEELQETLRDIQAKQRMRKLSSISSPLWALPLHVPEWKRNPLQELQM